MHKGKKYTLIYGVFLLAVAFACSPQARLLNEIPINSVSVEVTDQDGNPVPGAQVEASNGRKTTTDEDGVANIRFGSVGVHYIGVMADNYLPANNVVTMPTDNGKMIKTSLTNQLEFNSLSFASANIYPMMFNYLFSSSGYGLELKKYKEGDWTSWSIAADEDDETLTISKSFLKRLDNGQEWWQIIVADEEDPEAYVAEVLFSEDRSSIRRLRERVGEGDVQEKPVSEGWYTQPATLTEESKSAALVDDNLEVEITRGTFPASQLRFDLATGMFLQLWESQDEAIPGGLLKYQVAAEDETIYESTLQDYGNDAVTMLESY